MLKDLILRAKTVLDQSQPPEQELVEAENALSAYLEAMATERISEPVDFKDLEHANRLLREVRRERSRRLAESQHQEQTQSRTKEPNKSQTSLDDQIKLSPQFGDDDTYDPLRKFLSSSHDPEAEELMDSAEEAFYAGSYQKAIPLFEKVLQIEPGWSRAQEHRDEAEEFLRTGNIPSVALPPEAGKAYGKAQSAARVFRYQTALDYLDEAFQSLNESGINRWREGEELRQDLENQIQAHEVYQEGLTLLRQGDLVSGLAKIQTAASAVALPEYVDKASEIKNDLATLDQITDIVNLSGTIPPEKLAEARVKLESISVKYGDTPQVSRLRNRMDIILPSVTASLTEKILRKKNQGDTANTLKTAKEAYSESNQSLEILQSLAPDNPQARTLEIDLQDSLQTINTLEDSIDRANESLKSENRYFPRNAYLISKSVRERFPQDPQVLDLNRRLSWYYITLYGGGAIAAILVMLMLWFGGRGITSAIRDRQLALTPSPTPTGTVTLTPTITATFTVTPTVTPEITDTPDFTPTPTPIITGIVARQLYAREGCYESEFAVGRIPAEGLVTLIALPERVFDNLNRECALIEYRGEERTVIGYVLLADLIFP